MPGIRWETVPQESGIGVCPRFLLFSRLRNVNNEHLKNCTSKKCALGNDKGTDRCWGKGRGPAGGPELLAESPWPQAGARTSRLPSRVQSRKCPGSTP